MYNGIGLLTPRGSGTSGYVTANKFNLRRDPIQEDNPQYKQDTQKTRKPNQDILLHNKKREIEVKLFELRLKLEDEDKLPPEEVEDMLKMERTVLEKNFKSEKEKSSAMETHEAAKRKAAHMAKVRRALGIRAAPGEEVPEDDAAMSRERRQSRERVLVQERPVETRPRDEGGWRMGNGRYGDYDEGKRRMGYSGRYGDDLPPRRDDRDIYRGGYSRYSRGRGRRIGGRRSREFDIGGPGFYRIGEEAPERYDPSKSLDRSRSPPEDRRLRSDREAVEGDRGVKVSGPEGEGDWRRKPKPNRSPDRRSRSPPKRLAPRSKPTRSGDRRSASPEPPPKASPKGNLKSEAEKKPRSRSRNQRDASRSKSSSSRSISSFSSMSSRGKRHRSRSLDRRPPPSPRRYPYERSRYADRDRYRRSYVDRTRPYRGPYRGYRRQGYGYGGRSDRHDKRKTSRSRSSSRSPTPRRKSRSRSFSRSSSSLSPDPKAKDRSSSRSKSRGSPAAKKPRPAPALKEEKPKS